MKTIDFLVQELPKIGGWPDGATGAGFILGQGELYFWDGDNCCPSKWALDVWEEIEDIESEVSREQYEAALAAKNDGWIEWGGGVIPISTNTFVDVKFNNGDVRLGKIAGEYSWEHVWEDSNIIAYRLHQAAKSEQVRADAWNAYAGIEEAGDEADLNECISQAPVTTWSGEGLPPVGCECEFMKHTLDAMPNWRRGIIKYVSEYTVVIVEALSPGEFVAHPRTCDFRPIPSEAERKREKAVQALCDAGGGNGKVDEKAGYGSCWFDVYDAIASGKIPGMKLED